MMGDNRPPDHLRPMEFLNIRLEDNLQPCPGTCPSGHPGPSEQCQGHTWSFDAPESTRPNAHRGNSGMEPTHLGGCSCLEEAGQTPASLRSLGNNCPLGSPQQNQSSSTQVVFWAGILQAQMCVLDLEEELEKTEGLRAELRCCIPPSSRDFLGDVDLSPSLPKKDEDSGDDSSGPGEDQDWSRGQMPGSSPEWGAEEDSIFFDNPLFLESPCSDTSAEGQCFSWGYPDSHPDMKAWPHSAQTLDSPLQEGTELQRPGSELGLESNTVDQSQCAPPPFPVPSYKTHPCLALGSSEEDSTVPPEQEGETSQEDDLSPCSPKAPSEDHESSQESETFGFDLRPATTQSIQPWGSQTPQSLSDLAPPILEDLQAEDPSWPQEPLISQKRGERDAGCFQEPMPCTLPPWGRQASPLEPGTPKSEGRGSSPRPSPVSSQEDSPTAQHHSPKWPQDASHPSLLEKDESELSSLRKAETEEVPNRRQETECENTARTEDVPAAQHGAHSMSAEGLPEGPIPQAQSPEESWRPSSGNKLANDIRNDKEARNLAFRLYHLNGFRKSEVAVHLRKNNDFSRAVAEAYLSFFHFEGQSLDRALRGFLQALVLSGETQERERILYQFSKRFHYCNPAAFPSVDSIHTLTCAIMLLNTDLHGQNIGKSMSCQEFISNLSGLQEGGNFPKELLKALYWSIRSEKLEWAVDEEETARPEKDQPCPPAGKISSPFLQMAQDPTMPTYKQGILARKMHHDADGKKTPWGKRGWKMFHTLLRGMALYFLKGEGHQLDGESLVGHMVDEPVGVHHSLASPATHYTKKPHVFQLRTADWRLYLFQAPTAKEMASWIARINLAAATHSAPPFPAAVGSQRRFVRPILPMSPAQSSLEEQHRSHENCLDAASDDLLDLQRNLPERRGRSRELEEYRLRKEYLEHEKTRYETYLQLLVARLHFPLGDLALWEDQLEKEAEDVQEPKPSLKKSHSSPSLHQDEAPTTAKVKRNISERRTYRKIIPKRNRNQL
ncbi:PH and SEC7 domain-containing protein 4 [Acomys russatus]|uniref:PH and SEC7 domain-containing protein 4 n=1 Tax=Acomys russatus TaxID=60746 RepID=UPI0021E22CBE|nr:PH and SEC7 domain-containing protein 4 [Acomys russatus]